MNIILTGGLGFIGKNLIKLFSQIGNINLVVVETKEKIDNIVHDTKSVYLFDDRNVVYIERNELFNLLKVSPQIDYFIHLGAITDTTSTNIIEFGIWNLEYSKRIWDYCSEKQIPLIYASSAATYGNGEQGFSENLLPQNLKPLNYYGKSKNDFDEYALGQEKKPPFWAGLKFFNVYGFREEEKGRMASVIYHAYNQIKKTGSMKLFKYGEQKRDFVFVSDICSLIYLMMTFPKQSGIYNVGTGKARTFNELADLVFLNMELEKNIEYIDMPKDLEGIYQSYTEAQLVKVRDYNFKFTELEDGIKQYIKYLRYARVN